MSCPCGCAQPFTPLLRSGKPRRYASSGCFSRDPKNRELVRARGRHASEAKRRAARQAALSRVERFVDKTAAYTGGYESGYNAAMRWWRHRYERALKQMQAADVSRRDGRAA